MTTWKNRLRTDCNTRPHAVGARGVDDEKIVMVQRGDGTHSQR